MDFTKSVRARISHLTLPTSPKQIEWGALLKVHIERWESPSHLNQVYLGQSTSPTYWLLVLASAEDSISIDSGPSYGIPEKVQRWPLEMPDSTECLTRLKTQTQIVDATTRCPGDFYRYTHLSDVKTQPCDADGFQSGSGESTISMDTCGFTAGLMLTSATAVPTTFPAIAHKIE